MLAELAKLGYKLPKDCKVLYITPLNSLQLSLLHNVKSMGIECEAVTSSNIQTLMCSKTDVLFIGPEVLKTPAVTQILLKHRTKFVLKVIDEAHLGTIHRNNLTLHILHLTYL